jgi:hypothetical protein
MRSERMLLNLMTKLGVRRYLWYIGSRSFQGEVLEKNSFSLARASDQVMPFFRSVGDGCLTQNQLFFISDKLDPARLVTWIDTVWLGEDT